MRYVISRGLINTGGRPIGNTNQNEWINSVLVQSHASSIGGTYESFDDTKRCSFRFEDGNGGISNVPSGFIDWNAFVNHLATHHSDGANFYQINMFVYLDIDTKLMPPTLYAKNGTYGSLVDSTEYNSASCITRDDALPLMSHIFNQHAGTDIPQALYDTNHDIKNAFWMRRGNRYGIAKDGAVIDEWFNNGDRHMVNFTDSDFVASMITTNAKALVESSGKKFTVSSPMYHIFLNDGGYSNIYSGEFGTMMPGYITELNGQDYSVIVSKEINLSISGKDYTAIMLWNAGIDTIYIDDVSPTEYRCLFVKTHSNGAMKVFPVESWDPNGTQRRGRFGISKWMRLDRSTTSESRWKDQSRGIFAMYQNKATGKCTPKSNTKIIQVISKKYKAPVFMLTSDL